MALEFITDVIDVPELIGYVREQTDGDLPFASLFPVQPVDDIEYELTQVPAFVGLVAKYRSWDVAPDLGKRPGVSIVGGEIPPLGISLRLNETDIIRFNKVRAGNATGLDQRVIDRIFDDAVNAGHGVQNRVTLAHGELLQSGQVTLTELGDVETGNAIAVVCDVPGNHFVTPATAWSDHANAVPVTDLAAAEKQYRKDNSGLNPAAWLVSPDVMADLALNAQIRALAVNNGVNPGIVSDTVVQQVISAAGVKAPLVVSDVQRPVLDGSEIGSVINARKVVASRPGMGVTLQGISATAAVLAGNGTIDFSAAPGVIAFAQQSIRPAQVITTGEAVSVPVIRDPNALFVLTV